MRELLPFLVLTSLSIITDAPKQKEEKLLGHWKVSSLQASGEKLEWLSKVETMTFCKKTTFQKIQIPSRIVLELKDGRVLTLDYRLNLSSQPQGIDLILSPTQKNVQVFQGIFLVKGDTLKLCLSIPEVDRPTAFTPKEGKNQVLLVLKYKP